MNDGSDSDTRFARWEAENAAYLTDALEWLRGRLFLMIPPANRPQLTPPASYSSMVMDAEVEGSRSLWDFFRWSRSTPGETVGGERLRLPPASAEAAEAELEALRKRMIDREDGEHPPALSGLARRLGMSRFEQDVLLLCIAMELDTRIASLCALAQDDAALRFPTFGLAFTLFDDPSWEVVSPERPLRYYRLLEVTQAGSRPLTTSALQADERIVNYVKGLNYLDDRLAHLVSALSPVTEFDLPTSQARTVSEIVRAVTLPSGSSSAPTIRLDGPGVDSKRAVASAAAATVGLHAYRLPAEMLPSDPGEFESLARLWQRETQLLPLALYIESIAGKEASAGSLATRFAARTGGLVFLDVTGDAAPFDAAVTVEVSKPTPGEQTSIWKDSLGQDPGTLPTRLAGQFNLNAAEIRGIVRRVRSSSADEEPLDQRLWDACLQTTRPGLDALAERIDVKATWSDIVLPSAESELLRLIEGQMAARAKVYDDWGFRRRMNRGLGITALFAGDSGTGKTMAAEVLANALRLHLYRIDLSAVVSKYIGETEKNLRRVFDAAEDGGAILFFDEADALFGKRSEVKDSHDRYANIEINYLLQRMEAYRGLAILATNMKSALDPAFMRRLRFVVNFPFPALGQRKMIWERAFPTDVPLGRIDYDRLARFNVAGGSIHNIALNAAFLAAQTGASLTMGHILGAARMELRKLDRPINEAELQWHEPEGSAA